jgi:hypothetical protein
MPPLPGLARHQVIQLSYYSTFCLLSQENFVNRLSRLRRNRRDAWVGSHAEAHSGAKILFAAGEKDEGVRMWICGNLFFKDSHFTLFGIRD